MNQYGADEFDDPELSRSLGRMSGAFPDSGAALGQVQSRVKQVRQRRAAAWSSSALVVVVAVGAFALTAQRPTGTQRPASSADLVTSSLPQDEPTSSAASTPPSTVTTLVNTTIQVTTAPVSVEDSAIEAGNEIGDENGNSGVAPGSPAVTPTTARAKPKPPVPTTPGTLASSGPSTAPSSPGSSNPGPSTSEPEDDEGDDDGGPVTPATQTYSGSGGSMTVSMDSEGHLRMLSYSANAGYTADDIRNGEQRVSIRFRNGNLTTRIRVEAIGDTMVPQIIEES